MSEDPRLAVAIRAACMVPNREVCPYPECSCTDGPDRVRRALSALDAHDRERVAAMRTEAAHSPEDVAALVRAARAIGTGPDDPADKREWIRLEIDLEKKLQPFRGIADG